MVSYFAESISEQVQPILLGGFQYGGYGAWEEIVVAIDKLHPFALGMTQGEVARGTLAGVLLYV